MALQKYYDGLSSRRFYYRKLNYLDVGSWMEFYEKNPCLKYLGIDLNRTNYEMAKAWIEAQLERYEENRFGQLGIYAKENMELVGTIGFKKTKYCGANEIEKATAIKPRFWKQGIGTEGSIALTNFIFENGLANSIIGIRHIDNHNSKKYTQALGCVEKEIIQENDRKVVKYQITKSRWLNMNHIYYPNIHAKTKLAFDHAKGSEGTLHLNSIN